MAFDSTLFAQLGNHDNNLIPNLYAYATTDAKATVDTAGYFNSLASRVKKGDGIFVNTSTGGTREYGFMIVVDNDGTTVDVADLNALGATDTD